MMKTTSRLVRPEAGPGVGRPSKPALLMAAALLTVVAGWYVSRNGEHVVYDMGYSVGASRAMVETWVLPLPMGYELAYWSSTPHVARDGVRFYRP